MRGIQWHLRSQFNAYRDPVDQAIQLSETAIQHLKWWQNREAVFHSVPMLQFTKPDFQMFTDASMQGWGGHLLEVGKAQGKWDSVVGKYHINVLELRAVWLTVLHFQDSIAGRTVLVATDNTTTAAYINKQGGTKSKSLMDQATQLFLLCHQQNVNLRARYIPGRLNVIADQLSRDGQILPTEWSMHPLVFRGLCDC